MFVFKRGGKKKGKKEGGTWFVQGRNSVGFMVPRSTTKQATKKLAEKFMDTLEQITEAEWTPKWPYVKPAPKVEKVEITFEAALEKFLIYVRPKTEESTRDIYKRQLKQQFTYLKSLKVAHIGQLEADHLMLLQNHWLDQEIKNSTILGYRRVARRFMSCLMHYGWVQKNLWYGIDKPEDDHTQTLPLDDRKDDQHPNWDKIRTSLIPFLRGEILMKNGKPFVKPSNPLWKHPESFLALLELMYHTGLRRSDAIRFDPRNLQPGTQGNFLYTTKQVKTKGNVTVVLKPWLAARLQALPLLDPHGLGLPFYNGTCKSETSYLNTNLSRPLTTLGEALGIEGGLRCHRFRDSFAVNYLNGGGLLEDLKLLLGHKTIAITERYYNPWVKSREEYLEKQVNQVHKRNPVPQRLTVVREDAA